MIKTIEEIEKISDLIRVFNFTLHKRIIIIYCLNNNKILHILDMQSLVENDMENNKFFKVKGLDIFPLLEKIIHSNTKNFNLVQREISLQLSLAEFKSIQLSENGFGYILYDSVNM